MTRAQFRLDSMPVGFGGCTASDARLQPPASRPQLRLTRADA
jgi:hypothetical protein